MKLRNFLSRVLAWTLVLALIVLGIAVLDSIGQTVYAVSRGGELQYWITSLAAGFGALTLGGRKLARSIDLMNDGGVAGRMLVPLAAVFVLFVFLISVSAISHAIVWNWQPTGWQLYSKALNLNHPASCYQIFLSFLICFLLAACIGRNTTLLNRTTSQPLYSARLIRSYLGASNPERCKKENMLILEPIDGDDIEWGKYRPQDAGGPLHIVNVTLNETLHARSGIENRTRKGELMAIGPCGISVGREHHALFEKKVLSETTWEYKDNRVRPSIGQREKDDKKRKFHLFVTDHINPSSEKCIETESLTLGQWVGISGAAVSTGMGNRTSLFTSILLGLFNVRLGYWWNSGISPSTRPHRTPERWGRKMGRVFSWLQPVYGGLIDEILARFHGANRKRWYLSDGGHFENLGGYELIRRRLPLIIIVDAECDPEYQFQGLGTLIRQARIDLGAEIQFLSQKDLTNISPRLPAKNWLGALNDLKRQSQFSTAHAAIAQVYYDGVEAPGSILLYIKPTLIGNEPADVLHYHSENPQFPQQTTADQFFDEAQWESYRKLGELIGFRLFGKDLV